MSIIYQALKKVQREQQTDITPTQGGEGRQHIYFSLPVSRVRGVLMLLFFGTAVILGWWAVNRIALYTHGQLMQTHPPIQPANKGVEPDYKGTLTPSTAGQAITSNRSSLHLSLEEAKKRNMKGIEFYKQGRFPLARNEFLAAVEAFPEYAEAYNNLGLTYKQLGDIHNAEDSYTKAMQYKPEYPEAMNNYGVLLDSIGKQKGATEYFKKSMALSPDYPDPYLNMAISLEKEKKFEEAMPYYEKFVSHMKQSDESLTKAVKERMLYLQASRITVLREP